MIMAQNISVSIDGKNILDDVSCDIEPGITCILGPNGAGKSTLLKSLSGGITPYAGQVLLDAKPLSGYSTQDLAKRRAVLGQNLDIAFSFKAIDIVMMGRSPYIVGTESRYDQEVAAEALTAMDAIDLKDRVYPTLSGGEKQRIQIARVLAQINFTRDDLGGKYLLLDEPISALDIKHQKMLRDVLAELSAKGLAIICILHDLSFSCSIADQFITLKNGVLQAMKQNLGEKHLADLYDVEVSKVEDQTRNMVAYVV